MIEPLPFIDDALPQYAVAITQLLYFIIAFLVVYVIGRIIVKPLFVRVLKRQDVSRHARQPLKRVVGIAIIFVAFGVAFGFAGFGNFLTAFAAVAAAATLAIGFALKDVISNFVSGVFIFTDEPFRVGDWIEWDNHEGVVEDIDLRVTRILSFDNELVTVPNSTLTDGAVKNVVAMDRLRVQFLFGVSYDDDIDEATRIIVEEAQANEDILDDPAVSVRLTELGGSYVGLKARYWIENPTRASFMSIRSEFVQAVTERYEEEGIDMPYPTQTLNGELTIEGSDIDTTSVE